jgi:gliding motility-associated-like protein
MGGITHNFTPCPDTVCTGLEVTYSVTGNQSSIYDWHITGGGLLTTDQTNDCSIVWGNIPGTYTISVHEVTPQGCESEDVICDVVVTVPDITFDPTSYSICLNSSVELTAQPLGGTWVSDFMNGNTFIGIESGTYRPSYQTNIYGCNVSEDVEVVVKSKYEAPDIIYTTNIIDFCLEPYTHLYQAEDSYGVVYNWFIDDVLQPNIDDNILIEWRDTTQTYTINVIAYDEIGCESEPKQITIKTETCQRLFAPNSFTPNGDGLNDIFKISGLSVYQPTLRVFNRWGVEVYMSSTLWWDGDSSGGYFCEDGVYNWMVDYRDKLGQRRQDSGHIILFR